MVDGTCRDVSKPNVTPDWRNWIRSTVAYHDKFCITPGVIEPGLVNHGRKGGRDGGRVGRRWRGLRRGRVRVRGRGVWRGRRREGDGDGLGDWKERERGEGDREMWDGEGE